MSMFPSLVTSPVISGHRGFKGKYPENSFSGFENCFKSGGSLIETDLWLSQDEVVVVSHDGSTKRVFESANGEPTDFDINTTDYELVLKHLKYIDGGEKLHTFKDLLNWYIANHNTDAGTDSPQFNRLMLDIKKPNPPKIIKCILQDMLEVKNDLEFWIDRVQFGLWDLRNIKYLNQDVWFREMFESQKKPLEIINISSNWLDSSHYIGYNAFADAQTKLDGKYRFKFTGVSLFYLVTWNSAFLTKFMPIVKQQNLSLYSWTVNKTAHFDYLWKVGKAYNVREYGVISDFPDLMVAYKAKHIDRCDKETSSLLGQEKVEFTWLQKFNFWLLGGLFTRSGVADFDKTYDASVDENEIISPGKPNKLVGSLFAVLVTFGIL